MKYSTIPEADWPLKCRCNGALYLALEIDNLSLTDGYPVQPAPWRQSVNARDVGRLKSQFMRSAKLPARDGAADSPHETQMEEDARNCLAAAVRGWRDLVNKSFNSCKGLSW